MIYLDNAATSFPKPAAVIREQLRCMQRYCGNPGRGSHTIALQAAEKVYECREELASLFGASHPEDLAFTMNATMALNTVIKGLLKRGDHVLISDMEHNAVLRPLHKLAASGTITYDVFPTYVTCPARTSAMICDAIAERIRPDTRMLICAHVSNICSAALPLEEIGALCRKREILFVVDASQSAGHLPIDMERMQIDAVCAPGHKGLMGPPGTGFFLLRNGLMSDTLAEGGSGYNSLERDMPEESPERYEAGTLPTPAIVGLCEGVRFLKQIGTNTVHAHACAFNRHLTKRLRALPGLTVYTPHHIGSVLLFNAVGMSADCLGEALNTRGFCVRAGYHCAPLAHASLGTPRGGAVRVSPSVFNSMAQADAFADTVETILSNHRAGTEPTV